MLKDWEVKQNAKRKRKDDIMAKYGAIVELDSNRVEYSRRIGGKIAR